MSLLCLTISLLSGLLWRQLELSKVCCWYCCKWCGLYSVGLCLDCVLTGVPPPAFCAQMASQAACSCACSIVVCAWYTWQPAVCRHSEMCEMYAASQGGKVFPGTQLGLSRISGSTFDSIPFPPPSPSSSVHSLQVSKVQHSNRKFCLRQS